MTTTPGPLHEQARRLAAGEVTSVDLVARALDDAEATQPTLNGFRLLRREQALDEARAADRRLAAGESAPLLGVPTAVKDDTDLAGHPTAFGCAGDFEPKTADAELPRRLRAAGAVIIGKTNTPELGQWPFTEGAAFGKTRNPWDLDASPGGSSGGAAAAVSAGVLAAAIGSDGAGSVRIPASWTNLVGVKPQRGRISTWPEPEAFHGITVNGPLARTVADAALLLDVTAGRRDGDLHTPPVPEGTFVEAARREPGRLRIALSTKVPFSGFPARLDPQIRAGVERLAEVLTGLGHDVVEADPAYGLAGLSFLPRSHAGLRTWLARIPDPSLLDPRTRENCRNARVVGGPLLPLARGADRLLQRRVGAIFDRVDVVLAPTTAQGPLAVGVTDGMSGTALDRAIIAACPYTWPWNVLGWPSVNVPAGFTGAGHPFGAQLMGPANSEPLLLSLAAQLEAVERWHEAVPPHAVGAGVA